MKEKQRPAFTVEEIIKATGGSLIRGRVEQCVAGISTDSRTVSKDNLFIPLAGERYDGHAFINNAVNKGATGILVQRGREGDTIGIPGHICIISVDDTLNAYGDIAGSWRNRFDIPVIAVTGSSGKTTTKEMIAATTGLSKTVLKNRGNLNNLVGLPLTLLEMNSDHQVAVLEMGTNRPGEIARLTEIARPYVGVITNVGPAHLAGLKSLEGVREEKGTLFSTMEQEGVAVVNYDDQAVVTAAQSWRGKRITFGTHRDAYVRAEEVTQKGASGLHFILIIGEERREVSLPVLGVHNVHNALAAAACSWSLDIDIDDICRGLATVAQVDGRMEFHSLMNGTYLIDDTYNANPSSVREALRSLKELKGIYRSIMIFGDMLELGDDAEEIHEDIGRYMADTGVDMIFLRGKFSQRVASGAKKHGFPGDRIFFIDDPAEAAVRVKTYLKEGDWVLIKGSRKMKMEEVSASIIAICGEKRGQKNPHTRIKS
ncbi:MAG: UDP-N-acetylmuramoyl-tripeptide--D-alanyl-D-alanine ligase [Deltaproteobacteria bacterium]|nr:UDP-N-acetylmuramoyl-tripeptide--D-alanyl-D-alanine ligase [Deltaproteobacteria bacterium]